MTVTGSVLKVQRLVSLVSSFSEDLIRVAAAGATGRLWGEGQNGGGEQHVSSHHGQRNKANISGCWTEKT